MTVSGPGIPARIAKFNGDQGCAILPRGETDIHFKPVAVPRNLPDAATQPWPMGDANAMADQPNAGVDAALDWGFQQTEHNTRAIVVVHHGKIVGERYAPGWTKDTPQISWSAGKSITAALVGIIVQRGQVKVDDVAPIKEWHISKEDPRREIRVRDLLRMSSGLDFANLGLNGPDSFTKDNKHMRIYFDGLNVFEHAVNQPQEIAPNTQYRYRNSDPLTLGRIVKEAVEATWRELPDVPAARAVRQDRRAQLRARDRRVGQLHHDRLRLRRGARLGALRIAAPVGRHVAGRADSAGRLARIHFHAGAR